MKPDDSTERLRDLLHPPWKTVLPSDAIVLETGNRDGYPWASYVLRINDGVLVGLAWPLGSLHPSSAIMLSRPALTRLAFVLRNWQKTHSSGDNRQLTGG